MNKTYGFLTGKPVTGDQLIGRNSILDQIEKLVLSGQSVVLIAPRRYGKSSILLETLNRLKTKNVYRGYIDIFSTPTKRILSEKITETVLSNKKLDIAFHKMKTNIKEILKQIELKQSIEDFEFILDFADKQSDSNILLSKAIDFINDFSKKNNRKIVFGMDEFGDLQKLNGIEIIKLFRSKLQIQSNASYIFSGSYESVMNELFVSSKSPFYRFARIIKLDRISHQDFSTYIKKVFEKINIEIETDAIGKILNFTNGHPYYTQLVCQQIQLNHKPGKLVKKKDIYDYIEESMHAEINYIEILWSELTRSKENIEVLLSLSMDETSIYSSQDVKKINVARVLNRLKNRGIVNKEGRSYVLTDPLLQYWIKRTILGMDKTECV
jgi:AAA+ ATPase superfamily predicted ATPase